LVTLPVKLQLLSQSFLKLGDSSVELLAYADGLAGVASQLINYGLLGYAYWRDTWPDWRLTGRLLDQLGFNTQRKGHIP
jgi:hypothetical protein